MISILNIKKILYLSRNWVLSSIFWYLCVSWRGLWDYLIFPLVFVENDNGINPRNWRVRLSVYYISPLPSSPMVPVNGFLVIIWYNNWIHLFITELWAVVTTKYLYKMSKFSFTNWVLVNCSVYGCNIEMWHVDIEYLGIYPRALPCIPFDNKGVFLQKVCLKIKEKSTKTKQINNYIILNTFIHQKTSWEERVFY